MADRGLVYALGYLTWRSILIEGGFWASNRLLQAVTTRPELGRVLVADPPRAVPVVLKRGPRPPTSERVRHLRPLRARRTDPVGVPALRRTYAGWSAQVALAARRHGLRRPPLVTNNAFVAAFAPLPWAGPVTWYATDDWTAHPGMAAHHDAYRAAYAAMRERGTAVVAVSAPLLARIAPTGPRAVVPNGIDPGEWDGPTATPAWFEALPRPRLVYVGTLDRRLDVGALATVADAHPDGSVVLVGRNDDPAVIAALVARPNVHVRPPQPRPEVVGCVRGADLGLVLHERTPLTEAMSPLKLYEYLAAGLPVLATDLSPMRGIEEHRVRFVAPGGAGAAAAAAGALALGPAPESERAAFVAANAWSARHDRILALALGQEP